MITNIATLIEEALSQAGNCVSRQQAFQAGESFGSQIAEQETDLTRRKELRDRLQEILKDSDVETNSRVFIGASLSAILNTWFGQLLKTSVPASALLQWRVDGIKSRLDSLEYLSGKSNADS